MKEQNSIPVTKVQRAGKFISTGAKIGGNYIKHYSKKLFDPSMTRATLDEDNAGDIYDSLSTLKGSALKVAQMLSMDKNVLPAAYQKKFTMAQYSAPPLSYPLVVKSFKKFFGKAPEEIFDTFTRNAVNAASMGQVHQATKGDKTFAVKIQYPGIAESVSSDLRMVRPMATRLLRINPRDLEQYIGEVESKLLEETDYALELERSIAISKACGHIQHLVFPNYYPEYSGDKILTMDWIKGQHLKEFLLTNPTQEVRNRIGQVLWDFYDYQVHTLKLVHADPHPGNFIVTPSQELGIIDFGCVKEIPEDFYQAYFKLLNADILKTPDHLEALFYELDFVSDKDNASEKKLFMEVFTRMIQLLGRPFNVDQFDFGDDTYFKTIFQTGEQVSAMKEFRNSRTARGPRHALYINRTYFGLYNILNELKAVVQTRR